MLEMVVETGAMWSPGPGRKDEAETSSARVTSVREYLQST